MINDKSAKMIILLLGSAVQKLDKVAEIANHIRTLQTTMNLRGFKQHPQQEMGLTYCRI